MGSNGETNTSQAFQKKKKMIQNGDIKASEDTLEGKKRRAGETKEEGDKKKKTELTHTHTHTRISNHHTEVKVHITRIHMHAETSVFASALGSLLL